VNVEVRDDIAEQQVVHMTRLENVLDSPPDILNVRPVMGEFVWSEVGEIGSMPLAKNDSHMARCYGMPFKKRLADSTAMEGPAGQVGTKGTSDTSLARFPVLRPGSFHVMLPSFGAVRSVQLN